VNWKNLFLNHHGAIIHRQPVEKWGVGLSLILEVVTAWLLERIIVNNAIVIEKIVDEVWVMEKIYIGIDPGQTGAIAFLTPIENNNIVIDFEDSLLALSLMLANTRSPHYFLYAAIEKVSSMPKQGVASSFKFGTNFGIWQGRLEALQIPFVFVTPRKWQKEVFDSMAQGDRKEMSLNLARRLFPWADLRLKKHHSRADALLIAEWLRRTDK